MNNTEYFLLLLIIAGTYYYISEKTGKVIYVTFHPFKIGFGKVEE